MTLSRRDMLKLSMAAAVHPMLPSRGIVSQVFTAPGAGNAKFLLVFLRWRRVTPLVVAHTLLDVGAFVGYALVAPHVTWL